MLTQLDQEIALLQIRSTLTDAWYGIRRVPVDDLQTVADNLGGAVIELAVRTETADQINAMLDQAGALGYQTVLNIYTSTTPTKRPWYWDGSEWGFPQITIETLQAISHHPALLAIYALHEPLDEGEGYVSVEQQRALYLLLKEYTDGLPVFTDIGGLSVWEERGVDLTDGICDYCCTFPTHFRSDWTLEQCLEETIRRIDADLDTQQRLMPNSQIVALINTYSCPDCYHPFRLPSLEELVIVRDHLCALDLSMMYYPWTHGQYDSTLEDAPQLWPAVAEGCTRLPPDISSSDKAVNQVKARVGDTLVYTLTVDNSGGTATAFLVTDTLDAGTVFAGVLGSAPGSYSHAAGVLTWTGTVSGLSQVRLAFQATISASASVAVTNTARFDDGAGGVYSDTVATFIAGGSLDWPDLSGSDKAVNQVKARVGDTLVYTLTVDNSGGTATAFLVTDTLDAGTVFAGVLGSAPGSYGHAAGVLTWTGTVSGLSQVRLAFQATISASASVAVTNTARFDDGAGGVYSDTVATFIAGGSLDWPDLSGSDKAVNQVKARVGDTLVYTLTVDNSGGTATAFLVTDTLDADSVFAGVLGSASGGYGHAAGVLTWTGTVSGLSQVRLAFQATISASASGAVVNTAHFDDRAGGIYSDTVTTFVVVEHELYLPLVLKNDQSFSGKSRLSHP